MTGGGPGPLSPKQWEDTQVFSVGHLYVLSHSDSCVDRMILKNEKYTNFLAFNFVLLYAFKQETMRGSCNKKWSEGWKG